MLTEAVLLLTLQAPPAEIKSFTLGAVARSTLHGKTPNAVERAEGPKVPEYRVEYIKKQLIKKGLSAAEVEDFFDDPRLYIYKAPPKRRIKWEKLRENIMLPESIERGKQYIEKHKETLELAHKKYGVAPEYVVAVFRIETNLELFFGDYYATSVFYHKLARQNWQEHAKQFIAMVLYCKQAGEDCHDIKSSPAGAFGIGQFMPLSYLRFAEDGDFDGVIDLFDADDAIMSTAKFLNKHGWKKSKEKALISYYGSGGSRHYRLITLDYAMALKSQKKK